LTTLAAFGINKLTAETGCFGKPEAGLIREKRTVTPETVIQKRIDSPAKINLHLAVGRKRADGFHGIESIFLPVSLYDYIDFQVTFF
jgi:hypothetical protein